MDKPPINIFTQIREACAQVAAQAEQVTICSEKFESYARTLPLNEIKSLNLSAEQRCLDTHDALVFVLTMDAINFGSGYSPLVKKRPGLGFYNTISAALLEHFERNGSFSADQLSDLTPKSCAQIFGQDVSVPEISELMSYFSKALNDLGKLLLRRYSASFIELVRSAKNSAATLVDLLQEMPYYRDVHSYCGFNVPLLKRAQITAADLALAFNGSGYGKFDDIDELTLFADNAVPKVLTADGLLSLRSDLQLKIAEGHLLPPGAPEEIEIRACALHAVELLAQALQQLGTPIPPRKLDFYLWTKAQAPHYKAIPSHRCRCVYY